MAEVIKLGSNGNFGVKEGGTLAYNDENGVFKAIELQSSRASGATYVGEDGLIKDAEVGVPRIDWTNGVGELLLEPQSTNYVTYSEDLTDASWLTIGSPTRTANYQVSPDGTQNSTRIQFSSTNQSVYKNVPTVSVGNFVSIYVKGTSGETILFGMGANVAEGQLFTLNGEWQRLEFEIANTNVYHIGTYQSATARDIEVWGAQAEPLNYTTSYIRNLTTGSTTRIADAVTGNSSLGQVINSSEGVFYIEMSALADDGTSRVITLGDGTTSNRIQLFYHSSNQLRGRISSAGSGQITGFDYTGDIEVFNKVALKYKGNDCSFWVNGTEIATDLVATMPITLNALLFDNGVGGSPFYGRIRDLRVYDTALTDAELTTLTTL